MKIHKLVEERSIGAEIGVWEGDSSQLFLSRQPQLLYLVDPWIYDSSYPNLWWGGKGDRVTCQKDMDAVYDSVVRRFDDPRVRIIRKSSQNALQDILDRSLDWVFVDANHTYEYVLADLRGWFEKLRPGGQLMGDDYTSRWPDVQRAVREFIDEHPETADSMWISAGCWRLQKSTPSGS